eukprot:scaffold1225_cov164-Amphora_coffeaeformis.AAC.5
MRTLSELYAALGGSWSSPWYSGQRYDVRSSMKTVATQIEWYHHAYTCAKCVPDDWDNQDMCSGQCKWPLRDSGKGSVYTARRRGTYEGKQQTGRQEMRVFAVRCVMDVRHSVLLILKYS